MMVKPSWWDYAIFNEKGLCGISKDAPKEEREKFEKHIAEREKYIKEGKMVPI